jgi:hypothetical protein
MAVALQSAYRAAAVDLLTDFKTDAEIKLQIYRARPRSIFPPTAFVDRMSDRLVDFLSPDIFQHTPGVEVMVLHGRFDSGDTVDQRDAFVDGFLEWVRTRFHAAGANTLLRVVSLDDDPTYVPDWLPAEEQNTYYGTRITLEGAAED